MQRVLLDLGTYIVLKTIEYCQIGHSGETKRLRRMDASHRDDMDASSASASARAHGGRGVDDTADAATAARWLEGAILSLVERERGHCWNGFGFGFWIFPDDGCDDVVEEWMDGSNAMDGRLTIVDCVCFVFVAESKTLVKQHAFHMKRATVSNLKTTTRLDTR